MLFHFIYIQFRKNCFKMIEYNLKLYVSAHLVSLHCNPNLNLNFHSNVQFNRIFTFSESNFQKARWTFLFLLKFIHREYLPQHIILLCCITIYHFVCEFVYHLFEIDFIKDHRGVRGLIGPWSLLYSSPSILLPSHFNMFLSSNKI